MARDETAADWLEELRTRLDELLAHYDRAVGADERARVLAYVGVYLRRASQLAGVRRESTG